MKMNKMTDKYNIISKFITDDKFYKEAVIFLKQNLKSHIPPSIYIESYGSKYAFIFKLILECHIQEFNF